MSMSYLASSRASIADRRSGRPGASSRVRMFYEASFVWKRFFLVLLRPQVGYPVDWLANKMIWSKLSLGNLFYPPLPWKRAEKNACWGYIVYCLFVCLSVCLQDFYRATACNATHGIAVAILSVHPSVRPSDACIVTKLNNALRIF